MKQPQYSPLQVEEQVCVIYAGTQGFLDKIPTKKVQEFEKEFLRHLHGDHSEILSDIRTTSKLSDATEAKLKDVLTTFTKNFA
jgi:F-type H+-transporting ATPase subunit alpha